MFEGSLVALVTPMTTNGEIDYSVLPKLLDWHLENKTDGIVILGSTGEGSALSKQERQQFVKQTVEFIAGRVPVIVGVGTNSTASSIEAAQSMAQLGVDGLLMICPYYNRPTQEGIYLHFEAINNSVDCPIVLYNHPGRTGSDMQPETVARLAELKNIVGVKEAVVDAERFEQLGLFTSDKFSLYSGDDASCLKLFRQNASGVISVVANIIPDRFHDIAQAALSENWDLAEKMLEQNSDLIAATNLESNPIAVKWAVARLGHIQYGIRLPLTPLTEENQKLFEAKLTASGLLMKDNHHDAKTA